MIRYNQKMRDLLRDLERQSLTTDLKSLSDKGFTNQDGCWFLSGCLGAARSVSLSDFPDRTGYEAFVNSVHIEGDGQENRIVQALEFINEVFNAWNFSKRSKNFVAIISTDEDNTVVKFHIKRPSEYWVSNSIERYLDAILVAESTDEISALLRK